MQECLVQAVTEEVGYEAELANVNFSFESIEEMGVRLRIAGYSDKIFDFAECFIAILFKSAEKGFEHSDVMNSIEAMGSEFANNNL